MEKKAFFIRVTGHVQSVGFRAFVKSVAEEMGVTGWVRNLPDGSVQIFSVFSEDQTDRWVAAVTKGPPFSAVAHVEIEETSPEYESREFLIARSGE